MRQWMCAPLGLFVLALSACGGAILEKNPAPVASSISGAKLPISVNAHSVSQRPRASGAAHNATDSSQLLPEVCVMMNNTLIDDAVVSNVTIVKCVHGPYTISVTVSGLTGTSAGLVLQDNGGDNLSVPSNGTYTFGTEIFLGQAYNVTVLTQPTGQTCTVTNPSGNASSNVTLAVSCITNTNNMWTWVSGANTAGQKGTYGTEGHADPGNVPGARYGASSWIDSSGNLWLFGGIGIDATARDNFMDDLWEFSGGEWTWIGGSNAIDQTGVYGTLGVGSGTNQPGARAYAASWMDASGNFWLFGGYGLDSISTDPAAALSDLWEYSAGKWIWQGGPNISDQLGSYGIQGQGSSTNIPGARYSASAARDSSGNVWLFGGVAKDSVGNQGPINDLWMYGGGQWTWVSGANTVEQKGTYSGSGTVPGAREGQYGWVDSSGNFWLFAGNGADSNGSFGYLNDLWEFSAGQWTWLSGSNLINQPASYGIEGVPDPSNVPGSREYSAAWIDRSGNFWLLAGQEVGDRLLTDLWKYSAGEWTWINGSQSINTMGTYGTLGQSDPGNEPGSRQLSLTWTDASGNLWLFGGFGWSSTGAPDSLNDLWKYQP